MMSEPRSLGETLRRFIIAAGALYLVSLIITVGISVWIVSSLQGTQLEVERIAREQADTAIRNDLLRTRDFVLCKAVNVSRRNITVIARIEKDFFVARTEGRDPIALDRPALRHLLEQSVQTLDLVINSAHPRDCSPLGPK